MIWRDIYMLLAIVGFTVCIALFNRMYPGANPELESLDRVALQNLGEYVMSQLESGPGPRQVIPGH